MERVDALVGLVVMEHPRDRQGHEEAPSVADLTGDRDPSVEILEAGIGVYEPLGPPQQIPGPALRPGVARSSCSIERLPGHRGALVVETQEAQVGGGGEGGGHDAGRHALLQREGSLVEAASFAEMAA